MLAQDRGSHNTVTMAGSILLVSHTHWDREWYRTFEAFRSRLVDTVDRVLDQLDEDPGWSFLLDGQAIVLEDYLQVRPDASERVIAAVRSGRLGVGPWYVQPDSLLPSGESHVRNLLEGRRVTAPFGGCSEVAYAPDSFGHPAQFPQLFAGFGLGPFVYWRGNGDEIDHLGPIHRWIAPDGSEVMTYVLLRGYFSAAGLPADPEVAAAALARGVTDFGELTGAPVVLMNGVDHMYPQPHTAEVARALEAGSGVPVSRGLLDELIGAIDATDRAGFSGDLLGGRLSNLLPGVWSSRLPLKLADRRAERALVGWAEPWAALGAALGLADESPSLRTARRAMLANQAHDSIGGCSIDEVHRQMAGRTASAIGLADATTARILERTAGLSPDRHMPWDTSLDLAVFNPSPRTRTDVVRVPLDGFPLYRISVTDAGTHPLATAAGTVVGYEADGQPVRILRSTDPGRVRMVEDLPALDVELLVADVPAFGWRRIRLTTCDVPHDDHLDDGPVIDDGDGLRVEVAEDGTFTVTQHGRSVAGLAAVEDRGDRGDTYDFDPVDDDPGAQLRDVEIERRRHASGISRLIVTRRFTLPAELLADRSARSDTPVELTLRTEARVAPGLGRVDLEVSVDNPARDHRLRLLFPTGAPVEQFHAATTFGVARRSTAPVPHHRWWHPPTSTFPQQGWVAANGVTIAAPGLPEAEVTADGVIAITLLRAVGWLSHNELRSRPIAAGPTLITPEAQCTDGITASLTVRIDPPGEPFAPGITAARAAAEELGLRGVPAGPTPLLAPDTSLLDVAPASIALSALKPAEDGDGMVLRVLNPDDGTVEASVGFAVAIGEVSPVRLDETPSEEPFEFEGTGLRFPIGPHRLRSFRIRPA